MEIDKLSVCSLQDSLKSNRLSGHDFHGYELLLLRKLQSDPALYSVWEKKLQQKILDGNYDIGEIPYTLWFLTVTLDRKEKRFLSFFRERINQMQMQNCNTLHRRGTLLSGYLNNHLFTELHLDGIFKYGEDNALPVEIFKCPSVRWLSLKYNYLDKIPPDIGRMANLECLSLTNNKLQTKSIPYSLTFCTHLKHLMLDNNLLDALPGFLLKMPSLETVHRHGNHNYFKSTFMWYHTDVNERILQITGTNDLLLKEPERLQFWAAKSLIGAKMNFFSNPLVPGLLRDYISSIYVLFNVCGYCSTAKPTNQSGFKVITFKNPYLGNTCVPFQHWACSLSCAMAIEIPAREEQIAAARELDRQYDNYIQECQKQYNVSYSTYHRLSIRRRSRRRGITRGSEMGTRSWGGDSVDSNSAGVGWNHSVSLEAAGAAAAVLDNPSVSSLTPSVSPSRASSVSQLSTSCASSRNCHCVIC